jgi:hypothetical protein
MYIQSVIALALFATFSYGAPVKRSVVDIAERESFVSGGMGFNSEYVDPTKGFKKGATVTGRASKVESQADADLMTSLLGGTGDFDAADFSSSSLSEWSIQVNINEICWYLFPTGGADTLSASTTGLKSESAAALSRSLGDTLTGVTDTLGYTIGEWISLNWLNVDEELTCFLDGAVGVVGNIGGVVASILANHTDTGTVTGLWREYITLSWHYVDMVLICFLDDAVGAVKNTGGTIVWVLLNHTNTDILIRLLDDADTRVTATISSNLSEWIDSTWQYVDRVLTRFLDGAVGIFQNMGGIVADVLTNRTETDGKADDVEADKAEKYDLKGSVKGLNGFIQLSD